MTTHSSLNLKIFNIIKKLLNQNHRKSNQSVSISLNQSQSVISGTAPFPLNPPLPPLKNDLVERYFEQNQNTAYQRMTDV